MAQRKTAKITAAERDTIHRDLSNWFAGKVSLLIDDMEMRCRAVDMQPDEFHGILMAEFADRVVQMIAALGDPDNDRNVLGIIYGMVRKERAKRAQEADRG